MGGALPLASTPMTATPPAALFTRLMYFMYTSGSSSPWSYEEFSHSNVTQRVPPPAMRQVPM